MVAYVLSRLLFLPAMFLVGWNTEGDLSTVGLLAGLGIGVVLTGPGSWFCTQSQHSDRTSHSELVGIYAGPFGVDVVVDVFPDRCSISGIGTRWRGGGGGSQRVASTRKATIVHDGEPTGKRPSSANLLNHRVWLVAGWNQQAPP